MCVSIAMLLITGFLFYAAIGAIVACLFVTFGVTRVDSGAVGSSIAFRLLIVPGAAVMWPMILWKWLQATHKIGRVS
jgi:hypothetical protein